MDGTFQSDVPQEVCHANEPGVQRGVCMCVSVQSGCVLVRWSIQVCVTDLSTSKRSVLSPVMNSDQLYLNVAPPPPLLSLVLILYAMQPADSSQPSIFTLLSFSACSHCASCTLGSLWAWQSPLRNLVLDSANPHYVSDPLP